MMSASEQPGKICIPKKIPPCGAAIPVSLTAARHGLSILSGSIFMIVSVRISVFDGR